MTTTTKTSRKIAHTTAYAVTVYRSEDGSVREYKVYSADGDFLGHVHWHPARKGRTAGYTHERSVYGAVEKWSSLTAYAREMGRRHGIEV